MQLSDQKVEADVSAVFDIIIDGGIAIVPLDVAYAIIGHTESALKSIFAAKRRSLDKPSGMFASLNYSIDLHDLTEDKREIQHALINEFNFPFSTVAPFNENHPLLRDVDEYVIDTSSKSGTLDMLLNAGQFHDGLANLCYERNKPAFGSSANISLTGSKFKVADIEPELIEVADIIIDHGTSKYANPEGLSSTIIDFRDFTVIRYGCCYPELEAIFKEKFSIELRAQL